MDKIVLATSNPHKLQEINAIAAGFNVEFINVDGDFNPVENGTTYEENSFIKAKEAAKIMKMPALADDTGLEIEALDGRPGLYSARYEKTPELRIKRVLTELENKDNKKAAFICVVTLVDENGNLVYLSKGKVQGKIVSQQKGVNGFGYDPIFYISELSKTMAELTEEEKNTISHRAKALLPLLSKFFTKKPL